MQYSLIENDLTLAKTLIEERRIQQDQREQERQAAKTLRW